MLGKVSACHLISQARKAFKFLILLLEGLIPPLTRIRDFRQSRSCLAIRGLRSAKANHIIRFLKGVIKHSKDRTTEPKKRPF